MPGKKPLGLYASDIEGFSASDYVDIIYGGTGANTQAGAQVALNVPSVTGLGASGSWGINITGTASNVTGTVPIANGGTGSTSAAAAITSLGALPSANPTTTGVLTAPYLFLNRLGSASVGIQWYSTPYNAWVDYMGPAGTAGQGPKGSLTPVAGTLVTSWGQRSFIENSAGFGWTFESGINSATSPAIMAEISSNTGNARFVGSVTSTSFISNIATGTAPLIVTSTTPVANLSIGGNAATSTTAGNVSNSATFSNNGLGVGSGAAYNGSAAITVSYNTIGAVKSTAFLTGAVGTAMAAVDIRNLSNPSTGIGYAGGGRFRFSSLDDAAGALYADVIDLSTYNDLSGGGYNSLYFTKSSQSITHKWAAAGGTAWTQKIVAYTDSNITGTASNVTGTVAVANGGTGATTAAAAAINLNVPSYANMQSGRAYVAHDFSTYINLYETKFINISTSTSAPAGASGNGYLFGMGAGDTSIRGFELFGTSADQLFYRVRTTGNWNLALTNLNYNTYAPTLTGAGASGNWGINITGSAPAASLTGTTLPAAVVSSSLTSVGTLGSLTVTGASTLNGNIVNSARTIQLSSHNPEYRWAIPGSTDVNWKKIADITFGTGLFSGANFQVEILSANSNWGQNSAGIPLLYFAAASRSASILDSADIGSVSGPIADYVRMVRISLGVFELQVRPAAAHTRVEVIVRALSTNGTSTIAYVTNPVDGSTVGTMYMPVTNGYTQNLPNVVAAGSVTAASFTGAGTGLTGGATNLSIGGNAATATNSNSASAKWTSALISGSETIANQVSVEVSNNGGTGTEALAAMSFHCRDTYGIHLSLRNDGVFGLGGWSSSLYRWYSDAAGNFVASGSTGSYSDPRLKENITPIVDALSIIHKLNGMRFTWKSGIDHVKIKAGKEDIGILADEVEAVLPEIVTESIKIDGDSYKVVSYEKMIPVLIEAVKQMDNKVNTLITENTELREMITQLKKEFEQFKK